MRTTVVLVLAVATVCVTAIIFFTRAVAPPLSPTSEQTALRIDGSPMPVREFLQFVAEDRANTIEYFQQRYGAQVDANFWTTAFGSATPRARLIDAAIADATRFAVQEHEAEKLKTVVGFSYESFLTSWQSENARRANALATGQVIYGPERYGETAYFQAIADKISSTLEQKLLSNGGITVSAATMHRYYESHLADYPVSRTAPAPLGPGATAPAEPFVKVESLVKQACADAAFRAWIASQVVVAEVARSTRVLDRLAIS